MSKFTEYKIFDGYSVTTLRVNRPRNNLGRYIKVDDIIYVNMGGSQKKALKSKLLKIDLDENNN